MIGAPGNFPGEPPRRDRPPAWLQEKLFERRIVFVTGRLDDAVAAQGAAEIMTLDASGEELWSQLREQGIRALDEVEKAYVEGDGRISVLRRRAAGGEGSHG